MEPTLKVCAGLLYLGSNGYQSLVHGSLGVSQQSVSNFVTEFIDALTDPAIVDHFNRFPSTPEQWQANATAFAASRPNNPFPG